MSIQTVRQKDRLAAFLERVWVMTLWDMLQPISLRGVRLESDGGSPVSVVSREQVIIVYWTVVFTIFELKERQLLVIRFFDVKGLRGLKAEDRDLSCARCALCPAHVVYGLYKFLCVDCFVQNRVYDAFGNFFRT